MDVIYIILLAGLINIIKGRDICQFKKMLTSCESDQVVVMQSSLYGRMKSGKCINEDFGFVGCHKDVLSITHRRCSGKQRCELSIPDEEMESAPWTSNQKCPQDLNKYLAANFSCQKVIKPRSSCDGSQRIILTGNGNISSYVSRKTHCGSTNSPFVIQGDDGQQIKIGLIDFGSTKESLTIGDTLALSPKNTQNCHHGPVYAIIKDTVAVESHTICGGNGATGQYMDVVLSKGHQLEVRILGRDDQNAKEFLLTYQVTGCPDIPIGLTGTWTRHGDTASYQCTKDSPVWEVKCQGTTWTGKHSNCSSMFAGPDHGAVQKGGKQYSLFSMTMELAIVVVCSIAFVVGVLIVVVGVFILRRKQIAEARTRGTQYYQHPVCAGTMSKDGQPHPHNPVHKLTMAARDGSQIPTIMYSRQARSPRDSQGREHHEHDYAYVDEHVISGINKPAGTPRIIPPPPPPPPVPAHALFGVPPIQNSNALPQQQQDTISLPDFEYLSQGYNTLDSRNFSALERESKRNRGHLEDNNNENRYS